MMVLLTIRIVIFNTGCKGKYFFRITLLSALSFFGRTVEKYPRNSP